MEPVIMLQKLREEFEQFKKLYKPLLDEAKQRISKDPLTRNCSALLNKYSKIHPNFKEMRMLTSKLFVKKYEVLLARGNTHNYKMSGYNILRKIPP